MDNFDFCNPVRVVFGKNAISKLSSFVPESARVLIIYGGGSIKKNGVYEQVKTALSGLETFEYGGIEANPHYETCMRVLTLVKEKNINFLLAVGGGSVIDATKFIALAAHFKGDPWDILLKGAKADDALPVGVVLTLAATGSEMNERAVITNKTTGKKLGFSNPLAFPKFAIMDPEVTRSVPLCQIANGVVDSFIHVVEQYLTYPVGAKVQDTFSESLMKVIKEEGQRVLSEPDNYDVRANLMWAASNALNGWLGVGVPQDWSSHRMGYPLTTQLGLDHAQTLAVILPGVMAYMKTEKQKKIISLGASVFDIKEGSEEERVDKTIIAVEDFFRSMGVKTRLNEYGIKESDLDSLVEPIKQLGWKLGEHGNIDWQAARKILSLRL